MKSPHRYVTLLATASLVFAGPAFAQSSSGAGAGSSSSSSGASSRPGDTTTGSSTRSSDSMGTGSRSSTTNSGSSMSGSTGSSSSTMGSGLSKAGAGSMSRVSKDAVKNRFTAKDLIGAAVYDPAGERIGDIADVDLHGAVPGSLAMSFNQNEAGSTSMGASSTSGTAGSGTYPQSNTATRPSGSGTAGVASTSGSGTSTGSGSMSGTSQSGSGTYAGTSSGQSTTSSSARSTGSGLGSTASDALADSSRAISSLGSSMSGATVFISVGGLWGIGDDLVSAPVSMLSYNTNNDRFELASTKAQVVALTENDSDAGYASTSETRTGSALGGSTAAGKQSFGDEASRVQSALRADPQVSSFAQSVTVSSDGDTIELRGSVDTEQHKKQILDAARRATSLKIEDELDVRD